MAGEEKTALEIILELPSLLKRIENRIGVLDTNLKILNSKMNKNKQDQAIGSTPEKSLGSPISGMPSASPGIAGGDYDKTKQITPQNAKKQSPKLVLGNIKVFSNVKTAGGKSVDGMTVNIFDIENDLIRNIVTDSNGFWECRLPVGKYSIEMIHPKLKTINKQFELLTGTKTFEII